MTATPSNRSRSRRCTQVFLAAAVSLYCIVGFPHSHKSPTRTPQPRNPYVYPGCPHSHGGKTGTDFTCPPPTDGPATRPTPEPGRTSGAEQQSSRMTRRMIDCGDQLRTRTVTAAARDFLYGQTREMHRPHFDLRSRVAAVYQPATTSTTTSPARPNALATDPREWVVMTGVCVRSRSERTILTAAKTARPGRPSTLRLGCSFPC